MEKITMHYSRDRKKRERKIQEIGQGTVILTVLVRTDEAYPRDWEKQKITDHGIIMVYNAYTDRLVTKLIARKGQVIRAFKGVGKTAPSDVLALCSYHEKMGWNRL